MAVLVAGALVSAVVIGARLGWAFSVPYLIRIIDRRPSQAMRRARARERLVVGWSGMRGSGVAGDGPGPALDFPMRNLILFLTFAVILATLVLRGLTLPALIGASGSTATTPRSGRRLQARLAAANAALERLDELAGEDWTRDDTVERLRPVRLPPCGA